MFENIMSDKTFVFFLAALIFACLYKFLLLRKEIKNSLEDISESLGGKMGGSFLGGVFIEVSDYREAMRIELVTEPEYRFLYEYKILRRYRANNRFLWVSWMRPLDFNLSITTPLLEKSSQTVDIIKNPTFHLSDEEVKINVTNFDDKYLVRSNEPQDAAMLLQDNSRREAMGFLFDNGFLSLKAGKKNVEIEKPLDKEDLDAEQLRTYLNALSKFALGREG